MIASNVWALFSAYGTFKCVLLIMSNFIYHNIYRSFFIGCYNLKVLSPKKVNTKKTVSKPSPS